MLASVRGGGGRMRWYLAFSDMILLGSRGQIEYLPYLMQQGRY